MAIFTGPTVFPTAAFPSSRRTLGDIKTELARPYNPDDETTLALAGDAWNSAIRAYNRYNWPWEVLTTDIAVTSGTDTYTLPSQFKAPLAASRLDSNSRPWRRLAYQPYESFVNLYLANSQGIEYSYTLCNTFETGQITFYPVPSSADTIRVWYYRATPTIQTDSTPVEAPETAVEAIMDWARYLMVTYKLADQTERIVISYRQAMQSRAELVAMTQDRGDSYGIQ